MLDHDGYIREWGMEQYVRDARINMIYEGTNTIQSLDLLGRKVLGDNGAKLAARSGASAPSWRLPTTTRPPPAGNSATTASPTW